MAETHKLYYFKLLKYFFLPFTENMFSAGAFLTRDKIPQFFGEKTTLDL